MSRRPQLRDPDVCPQCGQRGTVIKTKRRHGYIWRRHACRDLTHGRWSSHQHLVALSEIDPADIRPDHLRAAKPRARGPRPMSLF